MKQRHTLRVKIAFVFLIGLPLALFFVRAFSRAAGEQAVYLPSVFNGWPIPPRPPTPAAGKALLTEVMIDPAGMQPDQEWFELYNDGGVAFSLAGYKVGDEEDPNGNEGLMEFPEGASLQPGQVMVIAQQAAAFRAVYGFSPDYEIAETDPSIPNLFKCASICRTSIELTNGGDELLLYDPAGDIVDALAWGTSPWGEFDPKIKAPAKTHTLERYPAYADTDSAQDWYEQPEPNPGQVSVLLPTLTPTPLPFAGRLLLSEVIADPEGSEPGDEWLELYNPSQETYALDGFKVGDEEQSGGSEGMFRFPEGAKITPGQVVVIANRGNLFAAAYGFAPDYEVNETDASIPNLSKYGAWATGSLSLTNGGDELLLLDGADRLVDAMAYGDSPFAGFQPPVPAAPEGASLERYPLLPDTDMAGDWRIQHDPAPGRVDLSPPPTPTPLPPLVINEIHADPHDNAGDANGDGLVDNADDEFIEIVNTSGEPIDLSGWSIEDGVSLRHTFPVSSVLPADCALVVFGGGTISGTFGGSLVYTATEKALGLNNDGDTVTLYDTGASAVISHTYGSIANDGQAITRAPDITGLFAKHGLLAAAAGRRFSPGTRLDGSPFPGCGAAPDNSARSVPPAAVWLPFGLVAAPGLWWWRRRKEDAA
ncbi:MAG: lamin tail domain-containing protein [Chloroflexota bacterium]